MYYFVLDTRADLKRCILFGRKLKFWLKMNLASKYDYVTNYQFADASESVSTPHVEGVKPTHILHQKKGDLSFCITKLSRYNSIPQKFSRTIKYHYKNRRRDL